MDAIGPILFVLMFIGAIAVMNKDMKEWGKYDQKIPNRDNADHLGNHIDRYM